MKTVKLIVVGFGNIGKGFLDVLQIKQKEIQKNYDLSLKVSAVCEYNGCLVNEKGIDLSSALDYSRKGKMEKHSDWKRMKTLDAIKEVDADIVLELTPGDIKTGEPGFTHIKKALESGKHVVTSNKAPLALHFQEINSLAGKKGLKFGYEATVGGAIPIINLYRDQLEINKVNSIYGVLNGTSNYILTKMYCENLDYGTALKEATELGIAEKDPSYDLKGIDTAVKLVILANSIMKKKITYKDIKVEGIEEITPEALELAKKNNYTIKLIGDVNSQTVSPRLIPVNHPLNVSNTLNAIMLDMDVAGKLTLVGHGAGRTETASAIFSDVMDIVRSE
jgi:homoserine dehydrogenase